MKINVYTPSGCTKIDNCFDFDDKTVYIDVQDRPCDSIKSFKLFKKDGKIVIRVDKDTALSMVE